MGQKDGLKALSILHHLLLSGRPDKLGPALIGLLAYRLRVLWRAKTCLDEGLKSDRAAKALKLPPFVAHEYLDQARRFETLELAEGLMRLHQTDLALKTGANVRESLEEFILWLTSKNRIAPGG